jgi:arginine N-succinyltransferase
VPARRLLEQEGLAAGTYIDIFDGGPVLQAQVRDLRATRDSLLATVDVASRDAGAGAPVLVCNGSMTDFRVALCAVDAARGRVGLPDRARRALAVEAGCTIRVLEQA